MDGIYCSTHGGRQADGALPALDCLPAVVDAADGIVHVLRSILAETDLIMAVDGYPTRADLTRDTLRRTCTCHHD